MSNSQNSPQVSIYLNEEFLEHVRRSKKRGEIDSVTEVITYSLAEVFHRRGEHPELDRNEGAERVLEEYSGDIGKGEGDIFDVVLEPEEEIDAVEMLYEKAEQYDDPELEELADYLEEL